MERYDVEKHRRFSPKPNPNPSNFPPARSPSDSSLSSCRSSLSHGEEGSQLSLHPSPPLAVYHFPDQLSSAAAANRSVPANPVTITEPIRHAPERFLGGATEDGGGGGGEVGGVSSAETRRMKTPSLISRRSASESAVKKAALGFRFFGFTFCLVSCSVMAADRNKGWAIDSFNRYIEFRYCIAVNAIGVLYSALQGLNLAYQLSSGKFVSGSHPRYIFDFTFDQILAYLLISSSSTAAIRVDDWQSNWGEDKFTNMARASVVVSFMAFVSLAANSIISGYTLCTS